MAIPFPPNAARTVGYANASTTNLPFILYCQQLAIGVNNTSVCFSRKLQLRESNTSTVYPLLQGYMTEQYDPCLICERVTLWRNGQNPYFIHDFEHSIFVIGDHQFHRGYSLILLKKHIRELHELAPPIQSALFQEVMLAGQAIVNAFSPWKMNYACYGNGEPHIHWHLFPRYESDPERRANPWRHASEFKHHLITSQTAQNLAQKVTEHLSLLIMR